MQWIIKIVMKKAIVLILMGLLFMSSCEKEDSEVVIKVYTGEKENSNVSVLSDGSVKLQLDMAGDYTHWYYYSFDEQKVTKSEVGTPEPDVWDLAFHRFDIKTNDMGVIAYSADAYDGISVIPAEGYVLDTENDSIAVDMTDVMNGNIGYVHSHINQEISRFVTYSLESYPPVYTYHPKSFVLRTKNARFFKLKVLDWRNNSLTANLILEYKILNY